MREGGREWKELNWGFRAQAVIYWFSSGGPLTLRTINSGSGFVCVPHPLLMDLWVGI